MFHQIGICCGLPMEEIKKLFVDQRLQEDYEIGKINSEHLYRLLKSKSPKQFSLQELIEAASDIFKPNLALWPTIEELKKAGLRLVLISNTCESHYNRLYSHYPILRLFDHKVLSFEIGTLKPDPRIFQKALEYAACDPQDCFYTDDIPAYVSGARKVGLDTELYTDVSSLRKHLVKRGINLLV